MGRALMIILSAVITLSGMVGCGNKNDNSTKVTVMADNTTISETTTIEPTTAEADSFPIGKWECSKMVTGDSEVTDILGFPVRVVMRFEFSADGTAVCTNALSSEVTISGRWELSDGGFKVYNEGADASEISFVKTDGGIMFSESEDGVTSEIYFTQVDEFAPFDPQSFQNTQSTDANS